MRKFILKIFLLGIIELAVITVIFQCNDRLAESFYGPNTRNQIEMSFNNAVTSNAKCWFLGNSRIYRINPDMISNRLWYNFAHDNDTYNQMYYKLRYLLDKDCVIDTLVVGTDYFQFSVFSDTRNYVYDDLLGKDYVDDYNKFFLREEINNLKRVLITKQTALGRSMMAFFKNRGDSENQTIAHQLRRNGSYLNDEGKATENDMTQRDTTMLDIQKHYFESIILLCKAKNIQLYVLMMPVRDNELNNYDNNFISAFNAYINGSLSKHGYDGHYIDMSNHPEYKDYKLYTDITHLNSKAADNFTKMFYEELRSLSCIEE